MRLNHGVVGPEFWRCFSGEICAELTYGSPTWASSSDPIAEVGHTALSSLRHLPADEETRRRKRILPLNLLQTRRGASCFRFRNDANLLRLSSPSQDRF